MTDTTKQLTEWRYTTIMERDVELAELINKKNDQARLEERAKILGLIDKYFRTKGFNSTDKEADSFAQFVVEVIREELRQQIKEMK
jgi:hypothetical protein